MSEPLKPFIPAWLDDMGLTQAEFRLYCHLCRRADKNGVAWPSVDGKDDDGNPSKTNIVSVCGMARRTAWKTINRLIELELIEKLGKRHFQGRNYYRVLLPTGANEAPVEVPIDAIEAPVGDSPIDAIEAPPTGANGTTQPAQSRPREGIPSKGIQRRKSIRENSPEEVQFANWFKSSLPQEQQDRLPKNWLQTYCDAHEELVRIDKRNPEQIREVCQWARTDPFWKSNFMSPAKLRKRNGDGIHYFDVFAEKMKQPSGTQSQSAVNTHGRVGTYEKIVGGRHAGIHEDIPF